jgi:uncharacterized membrane protein YiaA
MAIKDPGQPTPAFVGASWVALLLGGSAFLIGLWNAHLGLSEKGYFLTVLMYGLFSAVSLQKSVRDRAEDIAVSPIYFGLAWISVLGSLVLLAAAPRPDEGDQEERPAWVEGRVFTG